MRNPGRESTKVSPKLSCIPGENERTKARVRKVEDAVSVVEIEIFDDIAFVKCGVK
jgi:hypothetical protein